jgi:hypothetical protein
MKEDLSVALHRSSCRKRTRVYREFETWKQRNVAAQGLSENEFKEVKLALSRKWSSVFLEERRQLMACWAGGLTVFENNTDP